MAKGIIDKELLTNIAAAIRGLEGTTNKYTPAEMTTTLGAFGAELKSNLLEQDVLIDEVRSAIRVKQGGTANNEFIKKWAEGSLTEITPENLEGVTYIRPDAFANLTSLASVELPSGISVIDRGAFLDCPITKLILSEGLDTIVSSAFYSSVSNTPYLTELVIPSTVTTIDSNAFAGKSIGTLKFQNKGDLVISSSAFATNDDQMNRIDMLDCATLPVLSNVSVFDGSLHYDTEIWVDTDKFMEWSTDANWSEIFAATTTVEFTILPEGTESIADGAYQHWSQYGFKIPSSLTTIGYEAFAGNIIWYFVAGENTELHFGQYCFQGTGLQVLDFSKIRCVVEADSTCFENTPEFTVKVPSALYDDYISHAYWGTISDRIMAV